MATLKLNNVIVLTEAAGVATIAEGVEGGGDPLPAALTSIGTNDQVLTANSSAAGGFSWVDASGGGADFSQFNEHIVPLTDGTIDLGSSEKKMRNVFTQDLHLENDRGSWTVIEEEDYLTLRNNKTNKVYKLVMEEIE